MGKRRDSVIAAEHIYKKIKKQNVLKDISIQLGEGEAIGIVGPNGAGKTTFLRLIASVIKPDQGTMYYNGQPYVQCIQTLRQKIGYIPQEIALFEDLTVKDQIKFWQKATKKKASQEYIETMLNALGLHQVMNKRVKNLSGGWMRKLNVCVGMIHDPDIILLDEPTVGVDLAAKDDLLNWLKTLHQMGKTIVLISHEWDVINFLCEKLMIMKSGEIAFYDIFDKVEEYEKTLHMQEDEELIKILKRR
jgi:ABC-2 type transport system ATP-binding protein